MRFFHKGPPECAECRSPLVEMEMRPFSDEEGEIVVTFRGLRVLACLHGHIARKLPNPDFNTNLLSAMFDSGALDLSSYFALEGVRGMSIRGECNYCGAPDTALTREPFITEGEIALDVITPFSMTVDLPVYTCESCGVVQANENTGEVSYSISEAITGALRAVGL